MRIRSLAAISMLLALAACVESPTGPNREAVTVPIPNALGPRTPVPTSPLMEDYPMPPRP